MDGYADLPQTFATRDAVGRADVLRCWNTQWRGEALAAIPAGS